MLVKNTRDRSLKVNLFLDWASMATLSSREPTKGFPFSNPWDISDGATFDEASGVPYFYMTDMEMSVQDLQVRIFSSELIIGISLTL